MRRGPPAIGVNLPWLGDAYGHDLGLNQSYPGWPVEFDRWRTNRLFALLQSRGIALVRFWLFEDGEGLHFDGSGLVTGLDQQFLGNLREFVRIARDHDIHVFWTLLDANSVRRRHDIVTRRILTTVEGMQAFIDHALGPVLRTIAPVAWGIDLCNEPEAIVTGHLGNGTGLGFDWCKVTPQFEQLCRAVRHRQDQLAITIGSGFQEHRCLTAGRYDDLGLDALSFHAHAHECAMPLAGALSLDLPVIVGELGWPVPSGWQKGRESWERAQHSLSEHLKLAAAAEVEAIFLWFLSDAAGNVESLVCEGEVGRTLELVRPFQESGVLLGPDRLAPLPPRSRHVPQPSAPAVLHNTETGPAGPEGVYRAV